MKELIQRNSTELDCVWDKQITSEAAFKSCPNVTKALHYTKKRDQRSGYLEPVKESLSHILSTNGEVSTCICDCNVMMNYVVGSP